MSNYNPNKAEAQSVQCAVCDRPIAGGNWFARIERGERSVAVCCASCEQAFEAEPDRYLRRIHTLEEISDTNGGTVPGTFG